MAATQQASGFVTQLAHLCGRSIPELEDLLGFGKGYLAGGYTLLLLDDHVGAGDFVMAGTTVFVGGVPEGETDITDTLVKRSLSQVPADAGRYDKLKGRQADEIFVSSGHKRIAKVKALSPTSEFRKGGHVPQWILTSPKIFLVGPSVHGTQKVFRRPDDSVYAAERNTTYI